MQKSSIPFLMLPLIMLLMIAAGCRALGQPETDPGCVGGKCDDINDNGRGPGSGSSSIPALDSAGPLWNADWTLCVFAANDDRSKKLVSAFEQDISEIQYGLGGSSLFRIMVQRDYAKHQKDEYGQPQQSERFGLYREQRFHPQTLKVENPSTGETGTMLLGETDTTDPKVLEEFLVSCVRRFPAKRYWVIITGHGDSWNGLAFDASTGAGDRLPLADLRQALSAASNIIKTEIRTKPGLDGSSLSNKIDVAQFDVCRLGSVEAATTLADVVDYVVASQEVVPNAGHPYSALRWIAQDHSGKWPKTVVKEVVADYVRAYVEGVSTVNRAYVGSTVSSVGLELGNLPPLLEALVDLRKAVLVERPAGFSCKEVFAISEAAAARASLVEQRGGRSPLRDEDPSKVQQDLTDQGGRASVAAKTSVDLVSLLEAIAGTVKLRTRLSSSCYPEQSTIPEADVQLSEEVRNAAMRVLDIIGQPHIRSQEVNCGVTLRYDGQYRSLVGYKSRGDFLGDNTIKSPFVVSAHKVSQTGSRAVGISVLWGDPFDLLFIENGTTALKTYRNLPFEQQVGWTKVFDKCIQQAQACKSWDPSSNTPNPCDQL